MIDRSFIDVITNIFGVFILLTLYLILDMSTMGALTVDGVLLPLENENSKKFYYLEIVGSSVIPVHGDGYGCDENIYEVIDLNENSYVCVVADEVLRKRRHEFSAFSNKSHFSELLKKLSPEEYYLVLLTRPSGFEVYHDIARKAKKYGFEIGWSPLVEESPLPFSLNGRRVGSQ